MTALSDFLQKNGRFPPVSLIIKPLDGDRESIEIKQFLSYRFDQSIIIPVDTFTFTFTQPGSNQNFSEFVQEGDIAIVKANGVELSTGIIDMVEIETAEDGEKVTVTGRDLMGQLEDNSAVDARNKPIWGNEVTVSQAIGLLTANTRIGAPIFQGIPGGPFLLATEPGESKLTALQRFLEPLNCLAWMSPTGRIMVGRPNMGGEPLDDLEMDREARFSNVLSMRATRSSTQIPNIILPVWSGQESTQEHVKPDQVVYNSSSGPTRLRKLGHIVQRAIVVSSPQGSSPQDLSDVNQIRVAGSNLLQAYALREIARANVNELIVQASVKGHYNSDLEPYTQDTIYNVSYPRADIDGKMYLFQVSYEFGYETGQKTSLSFCKLGRIVARTSIESVQREIKKRRDIR